MSVYVDVVLPIAISINAGPLYFGFLYLLLSIFLSSFVSSVPCLIALSCLPGTDTLHLNIFTFSIVNC